MRGEQSTKADDARQVLIGSANEAQVAIVRAERKRYASTAIIIGPSGEPLFHIVSTWWSRVVVFGYGIMLCIIMLLAILVYYNKSRINTLEEKVDDNKTQSEKTDDTKVDKK